MRVDIMSHLRGVDAFPKLWARRTSMRLVGAHYFQTREHPRPPRSGSGCESCERPA